MIQNVAPFPITCLYSHLMYLKTVEGAVVFEREDMVWNREEVPLCCDQTPNVHGLGCGRSRKRSTGHGGFLNTLNIIWFLLEWNALNNIITVKSNNNLLYHVEFTLDFTYRIQPWGSLSWAGTRMTQWLTQAVGYWTNNKHCSPTTVPQVRSTKQIIHIKN